MDVQIGKFNTRDGLKLHFEQWSPPTYKGMILLVHGLGDHCGRYGPLVDHFTKRGFKILLYDQRGHGRSEGRRAHAKKLDIFLEDLLDYFHFSRDGAGPSLPLFLLGHSFGGQIVLNFLARHPHLFKAACVSSPNIEIALTMPKWQEKLSYKMVPIWPTLKLKGLDRPHLLTHDSEVSKAYQKDPLISTFVTIGLGSEILSNSKTIYHLCHQIKTPLLLLHGLEDHYCSYKGTQRFFQELQLDQKRLKLYEGMYHELLNEVARENVFQEIESWFCSFIGS